MRLAEGTTVDERYRLERRLGSGGMADVWLATDTELGRPIALKVLHDRFAQDASFVERFRREAAAAAGLQHPNVVGVFDRGQVDRTYYIAMEYVEGSSLKELIDRGLNVAQAVEITRQILAAESFAHQHGIVHRDIKPQNVIVDPGGRVRVLDFGIARAGASEITATGSVMGTAHYLSPEQAQGMEVTPVSDLYSIGVILYEALTGRVPFEGDSAVTVALKQVSQSPQRPSAINPQVSPALDAVVMRALAKDPSQRFQDAAAFSAALEAAQRDPAATGPNTAAFAALPPAAVAEAPDEEEREEERRRNGRWLLALAAVVLALLAALALTRDTTTVVPDVTGEQLSDAIDILQQDGFEVGERRRVQRQAPAGQVLSQDPSGEASKDCAFLSFFCKQPTVDLGISAGPGRAVVPEVVGLDRSEAARRLERRGFGVEVETAFSDEVAEGTVIRTDPAPGESARRGSAVTMTVSRGPRPVVVPPLIGLTRPEAVGRIRERGLVASVSEAESNRTANTVISQSPGPGSELAKGAAVSVVVSSGIPTVKVPGLVGMTRQDAVAELRSRGLEPVVETRDVALEEKDDRVVQQSPTGGTELEEGDSVTITIGRFVAPQPPAVTP